MKNLVLLFCIMLIASMSAAEDIQITFENNVLSIENDIIKRDYNTLDTFYPTSFYHKDIEQNLITAPNNTWFKFVINNDTLNSAGYQSHAIRELGHGGKEVDIRLENNDIIIHYLVQIFPGNSLTRERFVVRPRKVPFTMQSVADNIQYIFPIYNLEKATELLEIRLASWNREQLQGANIDAFPLDREWNSGDVSGANLSQCHMYHPAELVHEQSGAGSFKGPILLARNENNSGWLMAYEHGSPDNDTTRDFIKISTGLLLNNATQTGLTAIRGTFTEHETFSPQHPLQTVWVLTGCYSNSDYETGKKLIWDYLYNWQSEKSATRTPMIYYNTWGWQRDDQREFINFADLREKKIGTDIYGDATVYDPANYYNIKGSGGSRKYFSPRDVLRDENRLLKEIDFAHECGVDVFVIDDGWFDWMGDWNVDKRHYDKKLGPIKEKLDGYGMRLGLWMAPFCVHKESETFEKHPEFMAKDSTGAIPRASWGRDMACLVSDFEPYFIEKSKKLIDMGCSYFKWDGIDGQLCYADNHHHGGPNDSPQERAERYGFELINSVTRIAKALTDYKPGLIIVYDVTEKGRNIGLEFFNEGRYFWMNNGASGYDDLSQFRSKSMRTIPYEYNSIVPPVLQTYAVYPHNNSPYKAQHYNLSTAILGGHGIWGDLSELSPEERDFCKLHFNNYKRIAKTASSVRPTETGSIGSSPEVYEQIDSLSAQGQVIAFSGSITSETYQTQYFKTKSFLGVIGHAYHVPGIFGETQTGNSNLEFTFDFTEPDVARNVFVLGNNNFGAYIGRSTCWLKDIQILDDTTMMIESGAPGTINIYWPQSLGAYKITGAAESGSLQTENGDTVIELIIEKPEKITIEKVTI